MLTATPGIRKELCPSKVQLDKTNKVQLGTHNSRLVLLKIHNLVRLQKASIQASNIKIHGQFISFIILTCLYSHNNEGHDFLKVKNKKT